MFRYPSNSFWREARNLCNRYGVLLILDEIPIALGRTGYMFTFEHYNIEPDILCLGKGLGGGIFPQAAVVTRDAYNRFGDISLGHYTHEKNPLGARAALTTLEILEDELIIQKVKEDEVFMSQALQSLQDKYEVIGDVRGMGLLWGVELVRNRKTKEKAISEAEKVMYECLKNGLSFKVSTGNVLQLAPALTIKRNELEKALQILEDSLKKLTEIT